MSIVLVELHVQDVCLCSRPLSKQQRAWGRDQRHSGRSHRRGCSNWRWGPPCTPDSGGCCDGEGAWASPEEPHGGGPSGDGEGVSRGPA